MQALKDNLDYHNTWGDLIFVFAIPFTLIVCSFYLFMLAITDWWM